MNTNACQQRAANLSLEVSSLLVSLCKCSTLLCWLYPSTNRRDRFLNHPYPQSHNLFYSESPILRHEVEKLFVLHAMSIRDRLPVWFDSLNFKDVVRPIYTNVLDTDRDENDSAFQKSPASEQSLVPTRTRILILAIMLIVSAVAILILGARPHLDSQLSLLPHRKSTIYACDCDLHSSKLVSCV